MRKRTLWSLLIAALAVAPLYGQYTTVDLTPGPNDFVEVAWMSGVAGMQIATNSADHAAIWSATPGSVVDLNPAFTTYSSGNGIGDGQQCGSGGPFIPLNTFGAETHALVWSGTAASAVDLNPTGWSTFATACAGGQQVGIGETLGTTSHGTSISPGPTHALLWYGSAASMVDLHVASAAFSFAEAVSGGRQAGYIEGGTWSHAVVWSGSAASAVDLNPPGFGGTFAYGITGLQVVGEGVGTATGGVSHALLWDLSTGSVVDLHPTSGAYYYTVAEATRGGQQVGFGFFLDPNGPLDSGTGQHGYTHALLWSGTADSVIDLQQFLPAGITDSLAFGIDAQGRITGPANGPGLSSFGLGHGFVWIPATLAATPSVTSIAIDAATLTPGSTANVTVTLDQPATAGGTMVSLLSTDASGVGVSSNVVVPEGQLSATAPVAVSATVLSTSVTFYAAAGDSTVTTSANVIPALAVSSLKLAATTLIGGSSTQATLTLNQPAPAGGATVNVSSSASAAIVPATITVPAGSTSASFAIATAPVTASTAAVINASINTLGQSASLNVITDTVAVTKAEYVVSQKQLQVQATSTSLTATMKLYVSSTGALIGTMQNVGGGKYQIQLIYPTNPLSVTVRSSFGGAGSVAVTPK